MADAVGETCFGGMHALEVPESAAATARDIPLRLATRNTLSPLNGCKSHLTRKLGEST